MQSPSEARMAGGPVGEKSGTPVLDDSAGAGGRGAAFEPNRLHE
jgi:hypothetical protein